MRGRKPVPTEQRRLEGNSVSHRPLPEPLLISGRPELEELRDPPERLTVEAQAFWRDIVLHIVKVGLIDRVDRPALEIICTIWDEYMKADRVVRQEGFFTAGPTGTIKEHPALKMRDRARTQYFKVAEQYGLTPLARTRLGLAELHRRTLANELDEALAGGDQDVLVDAEVVDDDDVGLPGV